MTAVGVEVRGFGYRPAGRSLWALRDVTFSVEPGERILLLGDSGSGKSTLLRALAGLLSPSGERTGSVLVDGVTSESARERVGLLLQDPDAGLVLSRAGEDVAFGPQNRGLPPNEVQRRATWALDAVGFPYPPNREINALSGGERQRLALAGVLALSPGLLLLDEPTSLLDPAGAALVRGAVSRAAQATQTTLIVVEHQVESWIDDVDRVIVLTSEGIAADGTADAVRNSPAACGTWLQRKRPSAPSPAPDTARANGPSLIARALGFQYRDAPEPALQEVDCDVFSGSVLAVTGPNGSGKSTLGFLLAGLAEPSTGSVRATSNLVSDILTDTAPHKWSAKVLAGRVGSVFQNPEHGFLTGRVSDELAIGAGALDRPRDQIDETVRSLTQRLRLQSVAECNPFTLSGGEQRRLSVAAALTAGPRVLVLDEPTFGQDPKTWSELAALILELRDEGAAIVIITHDVDLVRATADRTLHLSHGRTATQS